MSGASCLVVNLDLSTWVLVGAIADGLVYVAVYLLGRRHGRLAAKGKRSGWKMAPPPTVRPEEPERCPECVEGETDDGAVCLTCGGTGVP